MDSVFMCSRARGDFSLSILSYVPWSCEYLCGLAKLLQLYTSANASHTLL